MRARLVLGLVVAALGLVACVPVKSAPAPCVPSPTLAQEVFELVNRDRVAHGVVPVEWDQELADFATWHSGRMAATGEIVHSTGSERLVLGGGARFVSENVVGPGTGCVQFSAEWMHGSLMASPLHRYNMLDGAHDALGIGTTFDGRLWLVQEFGQPVPSLN